MKTINNTFSNQKYVSIAYLLLLIISNSLQAQNIDNLKFDSVEFTIVFTKFTSDYELKYYVIDLNKHNIKLEILRKKRNTQGHLIELVMKFEDQNGIKGKSKQIRAIPIRKVYLNIKRHVDGTNKIGFFDHQSLKNYPFDPDIEKKISIIESINYSSYILIDGVLSKKHDLEDLDIYVIDKIEIFTDIDTLKKHNALKKKEVVKVFTRKTER